MVKKGKNVSAEKFILIRCTVYAIYSRIREIEVFTEITARLDDDKPPRSNHVAFRTLLKPPFAIRTSFCYRK